MPDSYVALAEPVPQDAAPSSPRSNGKFLAPISLFIGLGIGLGFATLWSSGGGQHAAVQDAINMLALPPSGGMAARVNAAENALKMFGIGPSRTERLALAAIDANNHGKGVTEPLGYWDPFGFKSYASGDKRGPGGWLYTWREAELKHGRVCMLASLGILVGENFHPLFGGNLDLPSVDLFDEVPLQTFWKIMLGVIFIVEGRSVQHSDRNPEAMPGDYGFDPLKLKPKKPEDWLTIQNKELNNGRLAMLATIGMIWQEMIDDEKILPFHS